MPRAQPKPKAQLWRSESPASSDAADSEEGETSNPFASKSTAASKKDGGGSKKDGGGSKKDGGGSKKDGGGSKKDGGGSKSAPSWFPALNQEPEAESEPEFVRFTDMDISELKEVVVELKNATEDPYADPQDVEASRTQLEEAKSVLSEKLGSGRVAREVIAELVGEPPRRSARAGRTNRPQDHFDEEDALSVSVSEGAAADGMGTPIKKRG